MAVPCLGPLLLASGSTLFDCPGCICTYSGCVCRGWTHRGSHPPAPLAPTRSAADVSTETAAIAMRVQAAAAYMARIGEALKGKLFMEEVEALLAEVQQEVLWEVQQNRS